MAKAIVAQATAELAHSATREVALLAFEIGEPRGDPPLPHMQTLSRQAWTCPLSEAQLASLDQALQLIRAEVIRAATKHGGRPFASPHEGYGVLLEEVDEFWQEIKANNVAAALDEVTQVGAMAAFYLTCFATEAQHG